MSGLLALLDDVAAIAKLAAASVDDITAHAAKASSKTAGVLIDDAAVTPKYVAGLAPARELPIIWRIARGSLFNKLILLLPAALLMSAFAPWLMPILLVMGGSYLCFEGAEKLVHALRPHDDHGPDGSHKVKDPGHIEEKKVKGAIKTDFILSAEIMTIALSTIETDSLLIRAASLALVGVFITFLVYGAVGIIVKADDVGLWLSENGRTGFTRRLGRGIVKVMPHFLKLLTIVGTAAMLWVGGSIIVHAVGQIGWHWPEETIHHAAVAVAGENATLEWIVTALIDGVLGILVGLTLIPVATKFLMPLWGAVAGGKKEEKTAH